MEPRRARPEDLDVLAALEARAFAAPWSRRALAGSLDTPAGRAWWINDPTRGESTAYALFQVIFGEAELLRIAVDPRCRRQGLGRHLLAACLTTLAKEDGVDQCHLEVRADNLGAQALYHALGFERVGQRLGYYADGVDALLYRRLVE